MPTPEFRWSDYEVRVPLTSPLRGFAARLRPPAAADEPVITIPLPDLTAWQSPLDKAKILLESAAEIEHALLVQYLYAAYSLKSADEVSDPAQQDVLDFDNNPASWTRILLGIAREEMGHLITVQNLLQALGLPPHFEREDFPPRKDLYPFTLHLEPLSQHSLAKYVVAEAPVDAAGIDDIISVAQGPAAAHINHVGVLYGLLGVVFAGPEQIQEGETSDDSWDAFVSHLAIAVSQQDPQAARDSWHLPDSAFEVSNPEQQAEPSDWQEPQAGGQGPQDQAAGVQVHRVTDRATARAAIREIAVQGEGPAGAGEQSHFDRFRRIYRGDADTPAFPAGDWIPTRNVSTDPRVTDIVDQHTRRWAELADLRYGILLGLTEHYLLTSGDDRKLLTAWIFAEMRSRVAYIARQLTTMPTGVGDGVASIPFTLPAPLHLPGAETARWALHKQHIEASIAKVQEMQAASSSDQADPYLSGLLTSDQARLAFITAHTIPATYSTSFSRDIQPLFRPVDADHMLFHNLNLKSHDKVKDRADEILTRLNGTEEPVMPPPPDQRWTKAQIDLFDRWRTENFPD
jgi:hypothetical protein